MMTFDVQVLRSVFRKTSPLLFTVATFLLLYLIPALPHQAYATDQECATLFLDGLQTRCFPFLDPATGAIIPEAKYLKCADTVTCDPDDPADPDKKTTKRCCIEATIGSYGGKCLNPELTRSDLGVGYGAMHNFGNFQQQDCNIDENALSPADKDVIVVSPLRVPKENDRGFVSVEQSLSDVYFAQPAGSQLIAHNGVSDAGLPVMSESIMVTTKPSDDNPVKFGITWYYTVTPNHERKYFVRLLTGNLPLYINDIKIESPMLIGYSTLAQNVEPFDPRQRGGMEAVFGAITKLPCGIGNIIKKPLYAVVQNLMKLTTNSENMPDISLLCTKGTPQFDDPTKIGFDDRGRITGLEQTGCTCIDANSGPGVAAVLLCTRFVAGINDAGAPWRLLVPAPENAADTRASKRFIQLLFGGLSSYVNLEDFRTKIRQDVDGFFNTPGEVEQWVIRILDTTWLHNDPNLNARFFGTRPADAKSINDNPTRLAAFKSNQFVRQYINCLACAKYGGFPSAIGCLPMDRVDRFLAEGVLGIGITFAGAFSVLCIIFGAIQFQLSEGESAKVQKAQKLITQCIIGLLIIIFSIFLLRFVGVDLLRIYGLG